MKDAAKLVGYFVAVIVAGALIAPPLFWSGQWAATHLSMPVLARYDFESYFHRALLVAALAWIWPLFRALHIRASRELQLAPNRKWLRDYFAGIGLAAIPLAICAAVLVAVGWYSVRAHPRFAAIATSSVAAVVVPFIEETFFRGFVLGVLLRSLRAWSAIVITAALFAIIHFLKAPEQTSPIVTWASGFVSIANSFQQFANVPLVLGGFCTLFVLACILGDARIRTQSLWMPIGVHAGWIFAAGAFAKIAKQRLVTLPWLGQSLLVGLIPLATAAVTWLLMRWWLSHAQTSRTRAD